MAMSKKDYVAIAKVLNHYYLNDGDDPTAVYIALDLVHVFANDNPRFDSDRFMSAVKQYPATASSF